MAKPPGSTRHRITYIYSHFSDIDNDVLVSFKQNLQVLKQVVHKAKDVSHCCHVVCYIRVFDRIVLNHNNSSQQTGHLYYMSRHRNTPWRSVMPVSSCCIVWPIKKRRNSEMNCLAE